MANCPEFVRHKFRKEFCNNCFLKETDHGPRPASLKVTQSLADVNVLLGESGTLSTACDNFSTATVTWFFNDMELKNSAKYNIQVKQNVFSLTVNKCDHPDVGTYRVHVNNGADHIDQTAKLNVKDKPKTSLKIAGIKPVLTNDLEAGIQVTKGESMTIKIAATGTPKPNVVWMQANDELVPNDRIQVIAPTATGDNTYTLTILNVQPKDQGDYSAKISNVSGSLESKKCKVTVTKSPVFVAKPTIQEVKQGETVVFEIKIDGCPTPKITWLFNGKPLTAKDGAQTKFNEATGDAKLSIPKVYQQHHAGVVTCRLENAYGTQEETTQLYVLAVPLITARLPEQQETISGKDVILKVGVCRSPRPEAQWFYNDTPVAPEKVTFDAEKSRYELLVEQPTVATSEGTYKVVLKNEFGGKESTQCVLTVLEPVKLTKITPETDTVDLKEGEQFEISVDVEGKEAPTVQLTKDDNEVEFTHVKGTKHVYLVTEVKPEHQGVYKLTAKNKTSSEETSVKLNVTLPHEIPEHLSYSNPNGDTNLVQENEPDDYYAGHHYNAPQTSNNYNNAKPCSFYDQCHRPDCKFEHPEGWSACYDGVQCINYDCIANHPPGRTFPCHYGNRCNRAGCHFLHPQIKYNPFSQDSPGGPKIYEPTSNSPELDEYDDFDNAESNFCAGEVDASSNSLIFKQTAIFIRNLPWNMPEQRLFDELYRVFLDVGPIKINQRTKKACIHLYKKKYDKTQLNGSATIRFEQEESAIQAIRKWNGKPVPALNNTRISIEMAQTREPGKYLGRSSTNPVDGEIQSLSVSSINLTDQPDGKVSVYWDIENMAIPRGQNAFNIVMNVRKWLITSRKLMENSFTVYSDISILPQQHQKSLDLANVHITHIPNIKSGSADQKIMMDLQSFKEQHKTPATIVLISGDIDFIKILNELRFRHKHYVIVIHNELAKSELLRTANEAYPWYEFFENTNLLDNTARVPQAVSLDTERNLVKNKYPRKWPREPEAVPLDTERNLTTGYDYTPVLSTPPRPLVRRQSTKR